MLITGMRRAIMEALRAHLKAPGNVVDVHRRPILLPDHIEDALRNKHFALRVGFLGILNDPAERETPRDVVTSWAIWICAKDGDKAQIPRDEMILDASTPVIEFVVSNAWAQAVPGESIIYPPERVRLTPNYQGETDNTATMASWAVSWNQKLGIEPGAGTAADLRPLRNIHTFYDLAPKDEIIEGDDVIDMHFEDPAP